VEHADYKHQQRDRLAGSRQRSRCEYDEWRRGVVGVRIGFDGRRFGIVGIVGHGLV
jgi:hypothetical protein